MVSSAVKFILFADKDSHNPGKLRDKTIDDILTYNFVKYPRITQES